jgi:hypothetical protein
MLMPKATVHKNNFAPPRKDKIGLSGQVLTMKPESVAESMKKPAQGQLRARILATYASHIRAATLCTDLVHRGLILKRASVRNMSRHDHHLAFRSPDL